MLVKMKTFIFLISTLYFVVIFAQGDSNANYTAINHKKESAKQVSHIDLLIQDISEGKWLQDEIVCQKKVLDVLHNVKNSTLWASWIWDSMQSPTGVLYGSRHQLGNYDQCLNAPWLETHPQYQTKYCLTKIKLSNEIQYDIIPEPHTPLNNYINTETKIGVNFNTINWGICVPVECNSKAISKLSRVLFKHTHLGLTLPVTDLTVDSCQIAGTAVEHPIEFYINIYVLAIYVLLIIICTALSITYGNHHDSVGSKFIDIFCIKKNTANLFKNSKGDISVLHGMRCIASGVIISAHIYFISQQTGVLNELEVDKDAEKYNTSILYNAALAVDTYFMMSGCLLVKGLMSSNEFNLLTSITKRYLRYIKMLAVLMSLSMHVLLHFGDGPLWFNYFDEELNACRKTWWLSLLMIGNYVDTANICYPVLWYLPCDFHMSVVGILLFWVYKKSRRTSLTLFTIISIAAIVMPGIVTYNQRLPAIASFDIRTSRNYRNIIFTNPTYLSSHLRAGPYFVGMAVGYLISIYKLGENKKYISKASSQIGFILASFIALLLVIYSNGFHDKNKIYNVWEAAIFISSYRTIWAIVTAVIIVCCEYGTVPVISPFLKADVFLPFSKLSYGIYLVHSLLFAYIAVTTRTPLRYGFPILLLNTFGIFVLSVAASFILHLLIEAPLSNITNILMNPKRNKLKVR